MRNDEYGLSDDFFLSQILKFTLSISQKNVKHYPITIIILSLVCNYINMINNTVVFKIKDEYKLELQEVETITNMQNKKR